MDDRGVSISLGDGLLIAPGVDVRSYAADLDIMAELRIPRINTVSLEPDLWPPRVESPPASNPLSGLASPIYRRPSPQWNT
jgi:hypothetical protein